MTLLDLSNNIWFGDLNETTDTSIVKILAWLQAHLGDLNNLIATSYEQNGNDAAPELGLDEAAIFSMIYLNKYYQRQMNSNLGASSYDILEVKEADTTIRLQNRNEIAKNYRLIANDIRDSLNKMVEYYKKWKCVPVSLNFSGYVCSTYRKISI